MAGFLCGVTHETWPSADYPLRVRSRGGNLGYAHGAVVSRRGGILRVVPVPGRLLVSLYADV
jgi:hypothetical protein